MTRQSPTTIAILGDHPVVENALAQLLEGSEYHTKIIQESPSGLADGLLDGVDLLLLSPALSNRTRDVVLNVVRGGLKTATMPVLMLSTGLGDAL